MATTCQPQGEKSGNSVSIALHSLTLPGPGGESREGGCISSPCVGVDHVFGGLELIMERETL